MPIVKCECKKCKYYDERFYCTKNILELTKNGQCKEGEKRGCKMQLKKLNSYLKLRNRRN